MRAAAPVVVAAGRGDLVKEKHYKAIIVAALFLALLFTSMFILGVKKLFDGEADANADPYTQVPVGRELRQAFGIGGNDVGQSQANRDILAKALQLVRQAEQHDEEKDYRGAHELYEEALEQYKKYPGLNSSLAISVLNELTRLEETLGLDRKREENLRTLITESEKAYNPMHQEVASALEGLGSMLCDQGRPAEALPFLERALTIRIKGAGEESGDSAYALSELAHCQLDLKNYKKADELYLRAIHVYENLDEGGFSESQQIARENLANSYCWQDRYKEALACELDILSDLKKRNLGSSIYAASTLAAAAGTAAHLGDEKKMQELIEEAQKIADNLNKEEETAQKAEIYSDIAEAYADDENWEKEMDARKRCIDTYKTVKFPQQEEQEKLADSLIKAGACSLNLKDFKAASHYYGQALAQARENQQVRVKLRSDKEEIEKYLQYIQKDKRAAGDATVKTQATELKEILG